MRGLALGLGAEPFNLRERGCIDYVERMGLVSTDVSDVFLGEGG